MKRQLLSFIVFSLCISGICQVPDPVRYSLIVYDHSGAVVSNKLVSVRLSIFRGSRQDTSLFSEKFRKATGKDGLLTLIVGDGSDATGSLASVDWSDDEYYLKTETDVRGGDNFTTVGIIQIVSIVSYLPVEATEDMSDTIVEDEMFISRKYVGNFLDYRQTGPKESNGPNMIWIKTTMENTYGKISAYGKKCVFSVGDKLYLKRTFFSPGMTSGLWIYQIENDSSVYYKVTDFQHDRKVDVQTLFF